MMMTTDDLVRLAVVIALIAATALILLAMR